MNNLGVEHAIAAQYQALEGVEGAVSRRQFSCYLTRYTAVFPVLFVCVTLSHSELWFEFFWRGIYYLGFWAALLQSTKYYKTLTYLRFVSLCALLNRGDRVVILQSVVCQVSTPVIHSMWNEDHRDPGMHTDLWQKRQDTTG